MSDSLLKRLYERRARQPEQIAFVHRGWSWSCQRLTEEVERVASALAALGARPGDRIALHMRNVPELAVSYYACLRIGAIAAPLNTRYKSSELEAALERLEPVAYIGQSDLYERVADIHSFKLPASARFIVGESVEPRDACPWERLRGGVEQLGLIAAPDSDAPAVLLATSGTTGRPKFVTHTASTLAAVVETLPELGLAGKHIAVIAVPMVHASGLDIFLGCVHLGIPAVLVEAFDAEPVLQAIEQYRATYFIGMPVMYSALMQQQRIRPREVRSLRMCIVVGDVCPVELQREFPAVFGTSLRSVWGASESVGCLTYDTGPGPISRVVHQGNVRIIDESGATVVPGTTGELVIRGPNLAIGYWLGPGRIEPVLNNGWYHTGDLMCEDESGILWFAGRKKDIIIRGGSNIAPVEVEQVLISHPAVRDAAVVGVPCNELGERVVGFIEPAADPAEFSPQAILAYTRLRLADYKVPERLMRIDRIPRNALGKVDRRQLRTMLDAAPSKRSPQPFTLLV